MAVRLLPAVDWTRDFWIGGGFVAIEGSSLLQPHGFPVSFEAFVRFSDLRGSECWVFDGMLAAVLEDGALGGVLAVAGAVPSCAVPGV